jgi:hypothetical protein
VLLMALDFQWTQAQHQATLVDFLRNPGNCKRIAEIDELVRIERRLAELDALT